MCSTDSSGLRLKFLQEAAYLLAVPSPSAAAFLGSASDRLAVEADLDIAPKEHGVHRREICGACGNVMVPGWSCKVSNRVQRSTIGKKEKDNKPALPNILEKSTAYTCSRCQRETVHTLQPKPRRQVRKPKASMNLMLPTPVNHAKKEVGEPTVKTTNANSKQRQKARKGGLQAMLDKNKSQSSGLGGLDLMDFAM